jgi:outer membrane lipoprotein SlyB
MVRHLPWAGERTTIGPPAVECGKRTDREVKAKGARGWLVALGLITTACSAPRPVLYPNDHYNRVGQAVAERDIRDCIARAERFGASARRTQGAAGDVATHTAAGAGAGAAIGAVGGAITGNAGEGAAVGAATGGTAGLLNGIFRAPRSRGADPVFADFVDRCLRERGYEPIGWQ